MVVAVLRLAELAMASAGRMAMVAGFPDCTDCTGLYASFWLWLVTSECGEVYCLRIRTVVGSRIWRLRTVLLCLYRLGFHCVDRSMCTRSSGCRQYLLGRRLATFDSSDDRLFDAIGMIEKFAQPVPGSLCIPTIFGVVTSVERETC